MNRAERIETFAKAFGALDEDLLSNLDYHRSASTPVFFGPGTKHRFTNGTLC